MCTKIFFSIHYVKIWIVFFFLSRGYNLFTAYLKDLISKIRIQMEKNMRMKFLKQRITVILLFVASVCIISAEYFYRNHPFDRNCLFMLSSKEDKSGKWIGAEWIQTGVWNGVYRIAIFYFWYRSLEHIKKTIENNSSGTCYFIYQRKLRIAYNQ